MTAEEADTMAKSSAGNARYWREQVNKHKGQGQRRAAFTFALSCRDAQRRARYFASRARTLSKQPVND